MKIEDKAIQILNKKLEQIKSENIKKGKTILGVTGTYEGLDTSDGTLKSQDMVDGLVGYSNTERIVGTMPNLPLNNLNLTNVVNLVNNNKIRIQQDLNTLITDQKAYVKRADQINVYVAHNILREAINLSADKIKLDEDILDITGTFISPMEETLDYDRCLEKTDSILGESSQYKWLEYIQSDGNQYIDTEYIPNEKSKIEIQFEYIDNITDMSDTNYNTIIGCRTSQSDTLMFLLAFFENGYYGYGTDSTNNLNITTKEKVYTVKLVDRKCFIKNELGEYDLIAKLGQQEFNMGLPMYIFAENQDNMPKCNSAIKLYYCKIYNKINNTYELVKHFIPVINKTTNEICLFDRVSKTFFNNMGSGNFIAGPEKSSLDIVSDYSACVDLSSDILGN